MTNALVRPYFTLWLEDEYLSLEPKVRLDLSADGRGWVRVICLPSFKGDS